LKRTMFGASKPDIDFFSSNVHLDCPWRFFHYCLHRIPRSCIKIWECFFACQISKGMHSYHIASLKYRLSSITQIQRLTYQSVARTIKWHWILFLLVTSVSLAWLKHASMACQHFVTEAMQKVACLQQRYWFWQLPFGEYSQFAKKKKRCLCFVCCHIPTFSILGNFAYGLGKLIMSSSIVKLKE
jgi:hypothetical protein